jgi:hypothetical protein
LIQTCGEETNIKIKKYQLISLIVVLGAVGLAVIALQPSKIALNGVLRNNDDTLVKDGFYDMRIVAVDALGQPLLAQDFSDVTVKDGNYAIPVTIPRFADTGNAVFQICRSEQPSENSDGLAADIPDGCKKPVEEQKTFSLAECPQTVTIVDAGGLSNVIGKRTATVSPDGCNTTVTSELITTQTTGQSSIVAINGKDGTDGAAGAAGSKGEQGPKGDKGDQGDIGEAGQDGIDGQNGNNGADGATGAQGPQGPAGDPASDDQTLAYVSGTQLLSIAGGNSVSLSSLLDNTDVLAALSCGVGQVAQWNGSAWICASAAVDTDDQTLSLGSNNLSIDNGNTVSLAGYLDNTDGQAISLASNILSISGNATTVNLSAYLDNTDVLAALSCGLNQIAKWNGSAWACAADGNTTYTGGTGISVVGTVISAALGTDVVSGEIVDGTIATADIAANAITSALINDGTIVSGDIADGTIANVKLANSSVTVSAGTGLSGGGTVALGGSVTLTNSLGTTIDSSEIADGSLLFADIAANGCNSGEIMEYNGATWSCGTDDGITAEIDGSTTNELQNIFQTISAPGGTNSVADSTTDTLAFANGSGVSITSDGTTDTITVAATLGTSIDSAEIVDGSVSNTDLANNSVTVTAGTGLTGGGAVSLGGSVSISSALGTSIDTSEIVDGTIVLADFSDFGCGTGQIIKYNGSAWACSADDGITSEVDGSVTNELQNLFQTIVTPDANNPAADSTTDSLTLANGAGVSITSNGTTDTITIATTLGTSIDSSEIVDGTITNTDISGAAGITNGQLANSSVTVSTGSGLAGGGSVSLGGTVTLSSALGTSIDSGEIVDGTIVSGDISDGTVTASDLASASILFSNIAQNGCSSNQIMKWNGSAWACAADATGSSINSFETIATSSGTSPVADSTTDTLTLDGGSGVTITGDGTTDTITIAATLGTDITSAEIVDGTIVSADIADGTVTNTDLANSSVTVTAGTGLTGGGAVSLGGTVTLNSSLGTSIDSSEIVDGTIATTDIVANAITSALINDGTIVNGDISDGTIANVKLVNSAVTVTAGTGLSGGGTIALGGSVSLTSSLGTAIDTSEITDGTLLFADIAANGCNSGEIMEYNGSAWSCGTDGGLTSEVDGSTTNEIQNLFETISAPGGTSSVADSSTDTLSFANGSGISITSDGATDTITIAATLGVSIDSSEIVDGTVSNTDLANSSVTVTAGTGLSGGGAVSLGGSVSLSSSLGTTIDTSEIVDGTIVLADFSDFGCGTNEIIKYNGSAWACSADAGITAEVDGSTTNELQNIFLTIATPDTNDPTADSTTDTLTLANGSGVNITSNGTMDTITIATTLGTSVDSSEITDGTITSTDISGSAAIANSQLANSSVTVTAGTGLSGGGAVSLGGTVTINSALGTSVDSSEIVNGTIVEADIAADAITSALIANGTIVGGDIADSTIANAKLTNSAVTVTAGTGLSGGGTVALGGTISLTSALGTAVDTSEITDGTILFADIAANGCNSGEIMEYNGSAWSCGTDSGLTSEVDGSTTNEIQNLFETISAPAGTNTVADSSTDTLSFANGSGISITSDGTTDTITVAATLGVSIDSSEIVDGTITNTDLANSAVMVTAGTGLTGGGAVSLGGSVTLNSSLGASIDTSEIVDGTIVLADFSDFGCGTNEIIKYNGSAWACSADAGITAEVDGSTTNELQNIFLTIDTSNGTDPVADSTTDTLALADGSGITITGDSSTDTITIASVLGTSIDSSEIIDGTVSNTDLANSSVTVTAGTGLSGGGLVSLGGTTTINLANDFGASIDSSEITNGTIVFADIAANSCNNGEIFKYNGSAWYCGTDLGLTSEVDGSTTNELQNLFLTIDAPNGTDPVADSTTDTLALADGAGITITGNSTTDTLTIAAALGTSIDSSEITDGAIVFSDINSNSCGTDAIFKFNGSAWYCGTDVDTDTTLSEANVEAFIFDGDNAGTLSSGTLALDSLTYTGTLDDTNINDALTISSSGTVADGALSANVSLFGSAVDSGEITNGTVTGTDLASATILFSNIAQNGCGSGDIMKWNGSAWACTADEVDDADASTTNELQNLFATINADNGTDPVADSTTDTLNLTSGAGVTVTGDGTTDTITIAATLGTDITSAEIVDGTIVSGDISDGTITGTDISDGSVANGDLTNSAVTVTAGSGLTTGGSVSLGGSVTLDIGAGSGITVNANDITIDLTTATDALSATTSSSSGFEVLASGITLIQGCGDGQLLKWNETGDVWACANDTDTTLSEATVESYIFDADNTGTLSSGTLALSSLSYTGTLTDTNIADTLTIGASSTIADGALSANVSLLGSAIESSEITDLTIVGGDIADDTIALTSKTTGNYVATITNGSGISGSSSSEGGTPTIALGPLTSDWNQTGAFDISLNNASSELKILESAGATYFGIFDVGDLSGDRTYTFPDVSGAVSVLGQTIESAEITDGTVANGDLTNSSVTITAGNGLTTGGAVSLGGSVTLDIGAGTGITVNANDVAITADGLNFTELSDTLSLDATTTLSLGASNFTTNLNGTGDYAIQFGGNTVFQIIETGAVTIGSILADQTIGVDNGTGTINIATDSDANTTNIGTGTGADTVTIGDSNANVALTDAQWSISGAGAANFASVTGAGLSDCDQSDDTLKWDSTTGQFSCGTNRGTFHNVLNGNYTNNATGFTDVDADADGTDDIGFAVGANETWVFDASLQLQSNTTADAKFDVTAPAGSTCDISVANIENSLSVSNLACGASTGLVPIADANYNEINVRGVVATGATTGTAMVQFGQNTASGTSTIASGSFITAYRISGADYAEIYYAEDYIQKGMIAQMTGTGPSQVRKASDPYSDKLLGIYSTSPGKVLAEADGSGTPIPIALTGRVPIKLSTENGLPKAGDMITASNTIPGYGMLATRSGYIVGQMMVDAVDNGDGTANGFVFVRHGYWQSPVSVDLTSIFGTSASAISQPDNNTADPDGVSVLGGDSAYLDQGMIDSILSGFTIQQGQIAQLSDRLTNLEQTGLLSSSAFGDYLSEENGSLSYLTDVTFTKDVIFKGGVTFNANQAGSIIVPPGDTQVPVTFSAELTGIPKIIASPNSFIEGAWKVKDISSSGFILELNNSQSEEVEFTWQSVLTQ